MPSFEYITTTGAAKNFDAPDQNTAIQTLGTFADRNPSSGVRMVTAPTTTQPPVVQPGQGAAWYPAPGSTPPPGTGGAPPAAPAAIDPDQQARDSAAKDLGYSTFDDFLKDVTAKPDKSTEQFYNDAYTTAGLPDLLNQISGKKNALNAALGTVNDNPWYDEAFRRGEASRLQTLAGNDIKNLEGEYQLRLGKVHDLVSRETADLAQTNSLAKTKLDYLHQRIQEAQATAKETAAEKKATDTAAATKAKPQTVTAPTTSNIYQYDPVTKDFKLVQKAVPKPPATTKSSKGGSSTATSPQDKLVTSFSKVLANRTALNKAGTREQFARQLQAQFPGINPDDIAAAVYKAYPDHYDGK